MKDIETTLINNGKLISDLCERGWKSNFFVDKRGYEIVELTFDLFVIEISRSQVSIACDYLNDQNCLIIINTDFDEVPSVDEIYSKIDRILDYYLD